MVEKWLKKGFILFLCSLIISGFGQLKAGAADTVRPPKQVRIKRYGNESLRLRWSKVKNADGYIIYRYNKASKTYKRLKTVKGRNKLFYVDRIGKRTSEKYRISSYQQVGNKKVLSEKSYYVKARTYNQGDKKVNVGKNEIKIVGQNFDGDLGEELAFHETLQLSSKIKPSTFSKAKGKTVISDKIRWYSTNPKVAKVSKTGLVTAGTNAGICYIYTRTHNGNKSNRIRINVVNYARPKKDELDLWPAKNNPRRYGALVYMFTIDYETTTDIADYFNRNRPKEGETFNCEMVDGEVKMEPENYVKGEMKQKIYDFIKNSPYNIRVYANADWVRFDEKFGEGEYAVIGMKLIYLYDRNCVYPGQYNEEHEMAPQWTYGYFFGV